MEKAGIGGGRDLWRGGLPPWRRRGTAAFRLLAWKKRSRLATPACTRRRNEEREIRLAEEEEIRARRGETSIVCSGKKFIVRVSLDGQGLKALPECGVDVSVLGRGIKSSNARVSRLIIQNGRRRTGNLTKELSVKLSRFG